MVRENLAKIEGIIKADHLRNSRDWHLGKQEFFGGFEPHDTKILKWRLSGQFAEVPTKVGRAALN